MVPARERALGRYELLLELARGGMAELFLGRLQGPAGFAKLFAIKRILPHLAQDKLFTQMFLDEGRIAGRLAHPNVCQIFELGELEGQWFLVMEYLEGVPFDQLIAAAPGGRPDPRLVAGVLAQAAEGLHYAHTLCDRTGGATPVVHRDVSPQNLFVTVDGVCKVLDFGVSKVTTDPSRTRSGVIKGKLPYMPPEQIRGDELDGRADVFALGVCAWEALAGERLFDRPSDYLTWQAILEEPVPSLAAKWPACPPAAAAVVHRALGRAPAERQASAQVFADELRGALGFASAAEIAAALRASCGARLAARSQQVAAALAGEPAVPVSIAATGPVTDAGETLDLKSQPAASMELRDHSAIVERETVRSQPVAQPPSVPAPSTRVPPSPPPASSRPSRVVPITIAVVAVAVLAVVFSVVALRGSSTEVVAAPRDAAVVVEVPRDTAVAEERPLESLDRLRDLQRLRKLEELGKLKTGLEELRDRLHGDRPATGTGRLKLETEAPAKVYEGDTLLGATPLDVRLPAGTHELRLQFDDGREHATTVQIIAGKTKRERIDPW